MIIKKKSNLNFFANSFILGKLEILEPVFQEDLGSTQKG
jgi:hypothetical protein